MDPLQKRENELKLALQVATKNLADFRRTKKQLQAQLRSLLATTKALGTDGNNEWALEATDKAWEAAKAAEKRQSAEPEKESDKT